VRLSRRVRDDTASIGFPREGRLDANDETDDDENDDDENDDDDDDDARDEDETGLGR
jgi:hypothetical protein